MTFHVVGKVLARRASRRPMDAHFLENVNKIHLIFQLIYKKHAPWMANFQFLAKSLVVGMDFFSGTTQ